jgi:hypothetical protein
MHPSKTTLSVKSTLTNLNIGHNIIKQLHDDHFPKKEAMIKKTLIRIQFFVEKFTSYILSAPHKHGIPELKNKYAHKIHTPMNT